MDVNGKCIWVDFEHQKGGVMLKPLVDMLKKEGAQILITARDFGNNKQVLDDLGYNYLMAGKHGGETLYGKMVAHVDRMKELLPIVNRFKPDLMLTFGSVESVRIAFGLGIRSISFNDEPRSWAAARLILPLCDKTITPDCIPEKEYISLGAQHDHLVRYHGIDEMAWISRFKPDSSVLDTLDVERYGYAIIRTEMTHAVYLREQMEPHESKVTKFLPGLVKAYPNHVFFVIPRMDVQHDYLKKELANLGNNVRVVKFLPRIQDAMYYSSMVASGGGTLVRESSLMNVPSLEFFPGETAPQDRFLIDNHFPLWHVTGFTEIEDACKKLMSGKTYHKREVAPFDYLKVYDDPIHVCREVIEDS